MNKRILKHIEALKATLGLMVVTGEISKNTKETLEIGINGISEIEAQEQVKLGLPDVRLSCYQEVWQEWCDSEKVEDFDKWLHDKLHEA